MSADDGRAVVVKTGQWGSVQLIACTRCGVLLWDVNQHYAHSHPPRRKKKYRCKECGSDRRKHLCG